MLLGRCRFSLSFNPQALHHNGFAVFHTVFHFPRKSRESHYTTSLFVYSTKRKPSASKKFHTPTEIERHCQLSILCLNGGMETKHTHTKKNLNHFRTVIPSENGGSVDGVERERNPIRQHGGHSPPPVSFLETGKVAHKPTPIALCHSWGQRHIEKLKQGMEQHERTSKTTGKPWTLEADKYTRAIIADCPERPLPEKTRQEYRRVYTRLAEAGITAFDKASSCQHWNKLRTACRWAMAEDIREWRGLSEQARKAGDLARAQHCTAEAWKLAVALDEQFLAIGHPTWVNKLALIKAHGQAPVNKSKRHTQAPTADKAPFAFLDARHRGERLAGRHSERLAVLALTGCRPAELMAGINIELWHDRKGRPAVIVEIAGAKVDEQRGQTVRRLGFTVDGLATSALAQWCSERGGKFRLETTPADYRSLNRFLQAHNLSCYVFRHGMGSDLKQAIAQGKTTATKAAQTMGHRSTASLLSYGTSKRGRGARLPAVKASEAIKIAPATREARAIARTETRKKQKKQKRIGWKNPPPNSVPTMKLQTPLMRGLRPPDW